MKADKTLSRRIIFLCSLVYMISYITRSNYSAVISEMVTSTGLAKSALSVALTGSFITYGAGQLISGWFGDRVQPRTLIALGLATTGCMNLLIPVCRDPLQMAVVWCLNGLAQAFMWPPIVKLMFVALTPEDYSRGCVKVSWGSSIGTIVVYLAAPLLILTLGWKSVFTFSGIFGFLGIALWLPFCPKIQLQLKENSRCASRGASIRAVLPALILVMLSIMMQGILRDGVTTWMPSYISETFHLRNEISILAGVILPVFTIFCYSIANYFYLRLKNPVVCACWIFGTATVASVLLYFFCDGSPFLSVALSAVITGCMHGVNLMLNGLCPTFFAKNGSVGFYSGLLNSCTYIGSAISAWLIPLASENAGWTAAIGTWSLTALAGLILCAACIPLFKKLRR